VCHRAGRPAGVVRVAAYSPNLNPDELAWAHVKGKLGRGAARTKADLKGHAHGTLRSQQQRAHLARSVFHAPSCAYAAA